MANEHAAESDRQARDALIQAAFAEQAAHRPMIGGTAVQRFQHERRCTDADRDLSQAINQVRVAGEIPDMSPIPVSRRHP